MFGASNCLLTHATITLVAAINWILLAKKEAGYGMAREYQASIEKSIDSFWSNSSFPSGEVTWEVPKAGSSNNLLVIKMVIFLHTEFSNNYNRFNGCSTSYK
ncbi:Uncharacterized protein Fot_31352 [Forsythia ovata]|uniref:Uncharacterized protein n=1 Tax=Forsythia ovata TaxID=205694 RepID=A0ABD1T4Q0_9LAMI